MLNKKEPREAALFLVLVSRVYVAEELIFDGSDLLCRFFTARPTYPLLSVRLEAGDGLWLPTGGVVYDVCTLDKREVDVALTILGAAEGEA